MGDARLSRENEEVLAQQAAPDVRLSRESVEVLSGDAIPTSSVEWWGGVLEQGSSASLAAYAAAVMADSPAGLWLLTENPVVTVAADSSGNGRDGTYVNGPLHSTNGPIADGGGSTDFDGINDNVNIIDNAVFSTAAFSVEAWIKADTVVGNRRDIMSKQGLPSDEWNFRLEPAGTVKFELLNTVQTTWRSFVTTATIPNNTSWHHVVATTDGTTLVIYVNGISQAGTPAGPSGTRRGDTTQAVRISGLASNQLYFPGLIFGAAYYPSQLSAARVLAHYEAAT